MNANPLPILVALWIAAIIYFWRLGYTQKRVEEALADSFKRAEKKDP